MGADRVAEPERLPRLPLELLIRLEVDEVGLEQIIDLAVELVGLAGVPRRLQLLLEVRHPRLLVDLQNPMNRRLRRCDRSCNSGRTGEQPEPGGPWQCGHGVATVENSLA